ncbi:5-histidylcysteine sulfoxide synthase/putative 4-mercaptohistidine N1-methyltransferase [Oceanisphaera litoralis]|uniref:5-histidylcysteine sulfoxide synthase n=1 Tax=Oceanisphaera litoralis TaxID=225144 RepID=UPI001958D4D4|nr:5-histidylcysteine sulfoxide synthase [Oceanisphaera litoralis]MBM7455653.1 5-histidylcysteine sulfoxide synthase/putative 4-mercaptohistidine N1-methyltransferase [Oceanisphaera litoralis]
METLAEAVTRTPLLTGTSVGQKREEIRRYFHQTFTLYERLFDCINSDQAYYLRPEPLRHPLIFYFGHTAVFFINKLLLGRYQDTRLDERLESMFAIGVDEMSWDDLDSAHYDWPTVAETRAYRSEVRAVVDRLITEMPLILPITRDSPAWIVLMGIEHERIHLETSSVIMRMLPLQYLDAKPLWAACSDSGPAPENALLPVAGDTLTLGKPASAATYGWDNEYGHHTVAVPPFRVAKYLVSNGEYLAFVVAGGYREPRYWTEEGQRWLAWAGAEMPRFWHERNGEYVQRNLLQEMPLPLNWPVEVNYLEAKAFCNWKAERSGTHVRLPTEAEWTLLRNRLDLDQPDWVQAPGNINLEHYASSCPVNRFEQQGLFDVTGNVWQWTETPIDGFPGFEVHPLYDDFSTPTFDGRHNLFKGGSWISTGNEATRYARYAFRRHFFQHAGFRYIESDDAEVPVDAVNPYETDVLVAQYLEFHYGDSYFKVPNYPVACVQALLAQAPSLHRGRALDLGCSVGRASFELARYFGQVDGIDFSARFIQYGFRLKENGQARFAIPTEGELVEFRQTSLAELGYADLADKIDFVQGDACNLKPRFTGYDLIFCGNLIDRLYDPALFLNQVHQRLNAGGYLVLTSPYTWLEEYTPREQWLGGIKVNGENFTTLDGLKAALMDRFELVGRQDIPFVIRETRRKFQHSLAEMTVWRLK